MNFDSLEFILLLASTATVFFAVDRRFRIPVLIAASLVFYAAWSVPLVSLIAISAVVDFTAGREIARSESRLRRRLFLLLSLGVNLGLLGYFKYANFFLESVHGVLGQDGAAVRVIDIVLPPGISFYTFQTMSYTIDVYRRKIRPTHSFARFFLYVSFFPQLIAGPIERAAHLLTQFDYVSTARFRSANLLSGLRMMIWGLFKKMVFADHCAGVVEAVYAGPGPVDGWSALVATYAFTLQIYFDFSAYSEIARGAARIFGVDLMRNFDQPYLTTNIADFWRRWHISLSTWIRDYIYIPLGGSLGGRGRTLFNLALTMFLSGLWHGAAWNFVLWGLFHGLLLLLHALFRPTRLASWLAEHASRTWHLASWFLTFHAVVFGWVLFRVERVPEFGALVGAIWGSLTSFEAPSAVQAGFLAFVAIVLLGTFLERRFALLARIDRDPTVAVLFYSALTATILLLGKRGGPEFIYFQF